jgi:hypothetical protein
VRLLWVEEGDLLTRMMPDGVMVPHGFRSCSEFRVRSETVPLYRRVYKADVAMIPIAQPTKLVSVNGIHVRVQDLTKKSKELWAATVLWSQAE